MAPSTAAAWKRSLLSRCRTGAAVAGLGWKHLSGRSLSCQFLHTLVKVPKQLDLHKLSVFALGPAEGLLSL